MQLFSNDLGVDLGTSNVLIYADGKGLVVREPAVHARVLQNVREYAAEIGWHVAGFTYSPIKGPKGNIEFLADIRPGAGDMPDDAQIAALVREAHDTLDK